MPGKRKSSQRLTQKDAKQKRSSEFGKGDCDVINVMYGMTMPRDLIHFWKFCQTVNEKDPCGALDILNLQLVGPFHYLNTPEKKPYKRPFHYHMKWRYFYDCPEFLTAVTSSDPKKSLFHIGYFRDDPDTPENCVVATNSGNDARLNIVGDNLFAAVSGEIKKALREKKSNKVKFSTLQKTLEMFAEKESFSLEVKSATVKDRLKKVVAKSFHGAGIVVPIVNDVGYRPLHHHDGDLKRLLKKIADAKNDDERMLAFDPIQEVVNYIQFANDECDYGMGLEFGVDLFCYGSRYLNKMSKMLLYTAYKLLKRDLYATICEKHLDDRREENFERI
ncbi:unnamed protein product [Clavelina lepadiformis]|uniref:Histone PARylation factor 1 n=1 Tax=Clavelina lepadiformis TaxID=159417 RepID=A0ABP0G3K2_CLALP